MEHGFVVVGLLFPSDQKSPESIEPRVAALHDPTSCAEPGIRSKRLRFIAARLDVQRVAPTLNQGSRGGIVVALVSAEMLSSTTGLWAGPTNRKTLTHGPHARVPTLRRSRYRDRRQAHYRLGRAHPWPGGIRTHWMTNDISWRHRNSSNPNRPAEPGRTKRPTLGSVVPR